MSLSPELLAILRCPKCRGEVALSADPAGLTCASCHLLYPVVDGIPHFLIDEAKPFDAGPPAGS